MTKKDLPAESKKRRNELIIIGIVSILIFLLTLPLAPLGLLRLPAILRFLYLALRFWRLLNTRCRPRLLPLFLDCRASLLRRGIDRGWSLNLFATPLLWLRACAGRSALLERR